MTTKVKRVQFEEQQVPKHVTVGERVYNFLVNCGDDGAMLMEVYDGLPDVGERHIRQCVREFVSRKLLNTNTTCRCGRGTIYIAKVAMKLKRYTRREAKHKLTNKSMDIKPYKDGKSMGKDGKRVRV